MPRFNTPREQFTATGIRIVGAAAAELVARAATIPLESPPPSDVLWAAKFRARPRIGAGSPVPAILNCVSDLLHAAWDACPPLTRDTPFTRPPARFQGISWDIIGDTGAWRGELVWRHPHPVLAGTPCITHLVIDEQQQIVSLTLCSAVEGGVSGVRGIVGAGQSRPMVLDALRQAVTLTSDGFDATPSYLSDLEVVPFVRDVMLSETRTWPVAVLAPLETEAGYLVPPNELAAELFGLAPLYAIERHTGTFRLTDAIGDRRLSAYWGALRVYRPEFSCADRSDDHWLLLRDRVEDPLERAALIGKLGRLAVERYTPVEGVQARRMTRARTSQATTTIVQHPTAFAPLVVDPGPDPISVSAPAAHPMPPEFLGALTDLPATLKLLGAQLGTLASTIGDLVSANTLLSDEIARLRTTTAIRATSANALERRLGVIEHLLRPEEAASATRTFENRSGDDETDVLPTLVDAVRHAGGEYGDALLMLDSAESSALESQFEDVDRAAAILQGMAFVARRRQEGGLDTGLRAAFQELGIDYRSGISKSTSERLRKQYGFAGADGKTYECLEHLAIGATYDPRHCLRIYFTSRAPSEPRFVIGHVGKHLTVASTT